MFQFFANKTTCFLNPEKITTFHVPYPHRKVSFLTKKARRPLHKPAAGYTPLKPSKELRLIHKYLRDRSRKIFKAASVSKLAVSLRPYDLSRKPLRSLTFRRGRTSPSSSKLRRRAYRSSLASRTYKTTWVKALARSLVEKSRRAGAPVPKAARSLFRSTKIFRYGRLSRNTRLWGVTALSFQRAAHKHAQSRQQFRSRRAPRKHRFRGLKRVFSQRTRDRRKLRSRLSRIYQRLISSSAKLSRLTTRSLPMSAAPRLRAVRFWRRSRNNPLRGVLRTLQSPLRPSALLVSDGLIGFREANNLSLRGRIPSPLSATSRARKFFAYLEGTKNRLHRTLHVKLLRRLRLTSVTRSQLRKIRAGIIPLPTQLDRSTLREGKHLASRRVRYTQRRVVLSSASTLRLRVRSPLSLRNGKGRPSALKQKIRKLTYSHVVLFSKTHLRAISLTSTKMRLRRRGLLRTRSRWIKRKGRRFRPKALRKYRPRVRTLVKNARGLVRSLREVSALQKRRLLIGLKKSHYSRLTDAVGLRFGYSFSSSILTFTEKNLAERSSFGVFTKAVASKAVYLLYGAGPCLLSFPGQLSVGPETDTFVRERRANTATTTLTYRPSNLLSFRSNLHNPTTVSPEAVAPFGRQTSTEVTNNFCPSVPESLWRAWLVDIALVRQKSAASKNSLFALTAVGSSGSNPDRVASVDPRSSNLFRTLTKLTAPLKNFRVPSSVGKVIVSQTHSVASRGRLSSTWSRKNFRLNNPTRVKAPGPTFTVPQPLGEPSSTYPFPRKRAAVSSQNLRVLTFVWASRRVFRKSLKRLVRFTAYRRLRPKSFYKRPRRLSRARFNYVKSVRRRLYKSVFGASFRGRQPFEGSTRRIYSFRRVKQLRRSLKRARALRSSFRTKVRSLKVSVFRRKRLLFRVSRSRRSRRDYLRSNYGAPLHGVVKDPSNLRTPLQHSLIRTRCFSVLEDPRGTRSLHSSFSSKKPNSLPSYGFNLNTALTMITSPVFMKSLFLKNFPLNTPRTASPEDYNSLLVQLSPLSRESLGTNTLPSNNLVPSSSFRASLSKKVVSSYASQSMKSNVIPWYYHTLVRFIEHATGHRALLQFYPFIAQSVSKHDAARYRLWMPRMASYERKLGHRFFLEEAIHIMHLAFQLHDASLFGHWLKAMIKRISFWKTRSIFRFLKYLFQNYFTHVFEDLRVKGLRIRLKGKISAAGNSRKRTILYRVGKSSHSTVDLRVSQESLLVNTFTGVMGLQVSIFY